MGKGICSRRQRRFFQSFLLLLFILGTACALMISYEMHKELKKTEATALQYQQHQESLSAQLQVVYEHHSKLEKSLQKERLEHKKAEEDFLAFKRESQKVLNKEKQDSTSRLNVMQTQHQILKSQHEDLKMQYYELQKKNQNQGEDHERIRDEHRQELDHLQREKEDEISRLKENAYNLQVENKQLRKAHQDIYTQLLDVRVEGFEENGKGFFLQGVSEIENNNETKVAVKQPRQIDIFAEARGKNEEKSTSKEREGEDESKKAVLEHSLSNPEELGVKPHNTLSQTLEKQIQTEPLHTAEGHLQASDPIITVGNAVIAHHVIAGQEDAKEYSQHHDMNFEINLNKNEAKHLNGDEFKEAKDTLYKSNMNKVRPEEDEELVVAGSPEQEDQPDEHYDDENVDDSVHNREKRADEEDNGENLYGERDETEGYNSLTINRSRN